MSARSLRPVIAVATVAVAALGCYLVSLRVATERASLEDVETSIVLAQRDIRTLQTEIGTRGRLEQLERWNVKVLALAAPKAEQFLDGGYQLARLARPSDEINLDAPVVLAAAPRPAPAPRTTDDGADGPAVTGLVAPGASARTNDRADSPADMLHVASFGAAPAEAKRVTPKAAQPPKPVKIATVGATRRLPVDPLAPKASAHDDPARAGSARDKATH